jgi:hypothetical protein
MYKTSIGGLRDEWLNRPQQWGRLFLYPSPQLRKWPAPALCYDCSPPFRNRPFQCRAAIRLLLDRTRGVMAVNLRLSETKLALFFFSGLGSSLCLAAWDEGEGYFTARVRHPTIAAQESGTYGGRRQSRWLRTAGGIAVLGSGPNTKISKIKIRDQHYGSRKVSRVCDMRGLKSGNKLDGCGANEVIE